MNEKLRYVAHVDNLTELYNRQGLEQHLNEKLKKTDTSTAVIYIDLDNFKYYNDTFGHKIGDLVLVAFANVIKKICRENGFAVRYGGDEFLLIIDFEQQEEIIEVAKGIFDSIDVEESFIPLVEQTLGKSVDISKDKKVSCSIGISFLDKQQGDKAFDIALKQADDALYYIKRTGKCRYEIWRPEMT
jgi:diguanylate cyclase (GGDEF)-like protein